MNMKTAIKTARVKRSEAAQKKYLENFDEDYKRALERAWARAMKHCPVKPDEPLTRKQLLMFANWFQGDRRGQLEKAIGRQIEKILKVYGA